MSKNIKILRKKKIYDFYKKYKIKININLDCSNFNRMWDGGGLLKIREEVFMRQWLYRTLYSMGEKDR
jgi:hypothetical protein